jgi:hypothetical protein
MEVGKLAAMIFDTRQLIQVSIDWRFEPLRRSPLTHNLLAQHVVLFFPQPRPATLCRTD